MIIESTQQDREMICPPDPERVIEGLRDTGYNFNTAIADLIDNSIAAGAKQIDINIILRPDGSVAVYVADNGSGMNEEELKNAMTYGSKRRSDPSSLGKFGLGLKTASTAFCRCLSVISRDSTGTVRKAQWDLDHIAVVKEWKLRMPDPNPDELQLLSQTANGTGTLVVWEKVDRLLKSYQKRKHLENALNKKIETLRFHIAMVFQCFLDHNDTRAANVSICLNTQPIEPWDPFCLSEKDTEKLAQESIPVELPSGQNTSFTLTAFMIPRRESFSTPAAMTKAKVNNDMQGFYAYRENRLIHYGDWFGMYVNEPHFSLLRIDLSFDHTMDVAFDIDIKKSRILMADEIAAYISLSSRQIKPA